MTTIPVLSCSGCGRCCSSQGTPPFSIVGKDRPPPELQWDRARHSRRYDDGLPCLWFDPMIGCRHYDHRPDACREFEMGGEDCLRMRAG